MLGRGIAGPAATRFGFDASWAAIEQAARNAFGEAGLDPAVCQDVHAGVGVAGLSRAGARLALEAKPHPFASVRFVTDGEIACLGAHAGRDGAIVIVGTGSCGIGLFEERMLKVGGYGFPVSDEGSGAALGLAAMRLALLAHDGRTDRTALLDELMRCFSNEPNEIVGWMDKATATDYAAFAPIIVRHAEVGDAAARRIMQTGASAIEGICRRLFERGAPRLSLIGGLASVMEAWLAPDLRRRLSPAEGDALDGAAILARRGLAGRSS